MRTKLCAALSLAACAQVAFAGAPLVTDDADVIEAKSCQFETWVNSAHGGHDYWAVPACNAFANIELSFGVGGVNPADEPSSQQFVLQAKTVFAGEEDVWSVGAVAGIAHDNGPTAEGASSRAYYAKALFTWFPDKALELDLNLGASNDFGAGTILAAGAALQYAFLSNTVAFGEVFRNEKGPGKYQVGLRYAIVPERFEVYASYGNKLGSTASDSWWAVAGIRINTAPFLP
jgi:hypothetical protein